MEQLGIKKMQGSIVDLLKQEILSGHIACGTEMTQNELAASLGVSRMPVREALSILEYQGLIERLPNNHVRVAEFSKDYFQKMFRLCAELEWKVLGEMQREKEIPVEEQVSDELEFHRAVCRGATHSYIKKNLQTITEIYIGFALQCHEYDKTKGLEMLRQAMNQIEKGNDLSSDQESAGAVLSEKAFSLLIDYFDGLADAVMRERMR